MAKKVNLYSGLKLKKSLGSEFEVEQDPDFNNQKDELVGLNRINVFIGENNVGKSRLLRGLFSTTDLEYKPDLKQETFLAMDEFYRKIDDAVTKSGFRDFMFYEGNQLIHQCKKEDIIPRLSEYIDENQDIGATVAELRNFIQVLNRTNILRFSSASGGSLQPPAVLPLLKTAISSSEWLDDVEKSNLGTGIRDKFYIPTLRGLNNFDFVVDEEEPLLSDIFKKRVTNNYKLTEDETRKIFTGQGWYQDLQKMLLGDRESRDKIREFENFLGEHLFEDKKITLVPKMDSEKVVHFGFSEVNFEHEKERAIYNVGDGIQTILLLTYPMFESESGAYFIEEPELHLHPKMQRLLLKVMGNMPQHQFFISTHSNSFLDFQSKEKSIYRVLNDENKKKISLCKELDQKRVLLDDLGIRPSEILQANGLIWVEGPSDRIYIKKWLQFIRPDLQEGFHFTFQYYGGSVLKHYDINSLEFEEFINALLINRNAFFVMDSDCSESYELSDLKPSQERVARECIAKDIPCWVTGGREIENYISNKVLSEIQGEKVTRRRFGRISDYCSAYGKTSKAIFARKAIQKMRKEEVENNFDLKSRIEELTDAIDRWNEIIK